ncbi:hypothetical protein [Azospirillum largimobile]
MFGLHRRRLCVAGAPVSAQERDMVRSAAEAKRRWRAPVQRFPRATPLPKAQRSR